MSDFSLIGGGVDALSIGYDLAATQGAAVTSSSSADTMGSYVELVSAANNVNQTNLIVVVIGSEGGASTSEFLVDIALGEAASEIVVIPELYEKTNNDSAGIRQSSYAFPIHIPSGVRISARCQSSLGSSSVIKVHAIRSNPSLSQGSALSIVDAIGSDTSTTSGVQVARSTANAFGSWVEMIASTDNKYAGFIVSAIRIGVSWTANQRVTYEVAIGSAGNEIAIYSGGQIITQTNEIGLGHVSNFINAGIPAGVRLSIRAQSDLNNSDGDLDYVIYGVR